MLFQYTPLLLFLKIKNNLETSLVKEIISKNLKYPTLNFKKFL